MSLPATVGSATLAARQAVIASLQQLLGDRLSTAASIRERHGKDASYHPCVPPEAAQDGADFCWTPDPEGRRRMWQARYDAFYALQARYPGTEIWVTGAC